jgi:hypothetical protein
MFSPNSSRFRRLKFKSKKEMLVYYFCYFIILYLDYVIN